MKTNQQKPKSLKQHRNRTGRRILHLLRLSAFAVGLILMLALFHLAFIGIPSGLTRQLTATLQEKGLPLSVRAITLSPHRGWVLHNVSVYSPSADDLMPLLQAKQLTCRIWPRHWTDLKHTAWDITLRGESFSINPSHRWDSFYPDRAAFKTIDAAQATLTVAPDHITLENGEVQWGPMLLRASGRAAFPATGSPSASSNQISMVRIEPHAATVRKLLENISLGGNPELTLRFDLPESGSQNASIQTSLIIPKLTVGRNTYEQLAGSLTLRDQTLHLESARISTGTNGTLSISGEWNIPRNEASIQLDNTLAAADLFSLLPQTALEKTVAAGFQLPGPLDISVEAGPAAPAKLLEQLRITLHNGHVRRKDLILNPLRLTLTRSGDTLNIEQIKTLANGAPLTGAFSMNLQSGAWSASYKGTAPTRPIGTLLGGVSQNWIDRLNFTNERPHVDGRISWGGQDGSFRMQTELSGRNGRFAGVPFETLQTTMVYTNHTFTLDPLHIDGPDTAFAGTVRVDLSNSLAFFDAKTSIPPTDIAQILAPDHPTLLTNFTFSGPVICSTAGHIDYSGGTNHAASGTMFATEVSAAGLTAKQFDSIIEAQGDELRFIDTRLDMFNGTAKGDATFCLDLNSKQLPYSIDMTLTDMDLNRVAGHFSTNRLSNTQGRLTAAVDLQADASTNFWKVATGDGTIHIQDGNLADLPVLGSFSRLIRSSLPGFSLFSLTTLYAEYSLNNGGLHSENLELGGTLMSAKAHGSYSQDNGLDFTVQAEPLRQTRDNKAWYQLHLWMADVLKEGTAPLFYLFEFKLTGSLENPNWELVNFPKEFTSLLKIPGRLTGSGKKEQNTETP